MYCTLYFVYFARECSGHESRNAEQGKRFIIFRFDFDFDFEGEVGWLSVLNRGGLGLAIVTEKHLFDLFETLALGLWD